MIYEEIDSYDELCGGEMFYAEITGELKDNNFMKLQRKLFLKLFDSWADSEDSRYLILDNGKKEPTAYIVKSILSTVGLIMHCIDGTVDGLYNLFTVESVYDRVLDIFNGLKFFTREEVLKYSVSNNFQKTLESLDIVDELKDKPILTTLETLDSLKLDRKCTKMPLRYQITTSKGYTYRYAELLRLDGTRARYNLNHVPLEKIKEVAKKMYPDVDFTKINPKESK